jgi:MbtH protein
MWTAVSVSTVTDVRMTLRTTKARGAVMNEERADEQIYMVVMNHEEQYSIWPAHRELPLGWRNAGKTGLKDECLQYIEEVWTDMRPLSLRKHMDAASASTESA